MKVLPEDKVKVKRMEFTENNCNELNSYAENFKTYVGSGFKISKSNRAMLVIGKIDPFLEEEITVYFSKDTDTLFLVWEHESEDEYGKIYRQGTTWFSVPTAYNPDTMEYAIAHNIITVKVKAKDPTKKEIRPEMTDFEEEEDEAELMHKYNCNGELIAGYKSKLRNPEATIDKLLESTEDDIYNDSQALFRRYDNVNFNRKPTYKVPILEKVEIRKAHIPYDDKLEDFVQSITEITQESLSI